MQRWCSKSNCSTFERFTVFAIAHRRRTIAVSHACVTAPSVSLRGYGALEASDVHDFHQVVLGLDGAMVMAVDGVAQEIDSGSAWLIPAGARHEYAGLGENRQLVLDLPAASLAVPQRLFDRARRD